MACQGCIAPKVHRALSRHPGFQLESAAVCSMRRWKALSDLHALARTCRRSVIGMCFSSELWLPSAWQHTGHPSVLYRCFSRGFEQLHHLWP